MKADFQRQLLTYLDTGHRHQEMKQMMLCKHCGERYKKGEEFYNRLIKEKPELLKREDTTPDHPEVLNKVQALEDRTKKDKLYQRHMKRLLMGSKEEKIEETKKFWSGYYERHYEEGGNILIARK